jgi:hypothetical protein
LALSFSRIFVWSSDRSRQSFESLDSRFTYLLPTPQDEGLNVSLLLLPADPRGLNWYGRSRPTCPRPTCKPGKCHVPDSMRSQWNLVTETATRPPWMDPFVLCSCPRPHEVIEERWGLGTHFVAGLSFLQPHSLL